MDIKGPISKKLKGLNLLNQHTSKVLTGVGQGFLEDNEKEIDNIRRSVNLAASKVRDTTGDNITEFFLALQMSEKSSKGTKTDKDDKKEKFININDVIGKAEESGLNKMLLSEAGRIEAYLDYRRIEKMIPQMSQAITTYIDNIISPDDYTKNSLNVTYEGMSDSDFSKGRILDNLKLILKKYKIDKRIAKILKTSLTDGDKFIACISLKKEITKFLSENADLEASDLLFEDRNLKTTSLKADFKVLEESVVKSLKKDDESFELKEEDKKVFSDYNEHIVSAINENVKVSKDSSMILNESFDIMNSFDSVTGEKKEEKKEDGKKEVGVDLNGSFIINLESERVIKLEDNDVCYGYLYFEHLPENAQADFHAGANIFDDQRALDTLLGSNKELNSYKKKFIYNVFVKGIANKIDKDFLKNNKEFKNIIYSLLKQDYIIKKKVRVTFFNADEVVHFGIEDDEGVYYKSLFSNITFSAKLYIAVLTSTLMHKLVRAPSKRLNILRPIV